jgi:hypothetical protein
LRPGNIRAGTPIAVMPAGTLSTTSEFAPMLAPSPMVTEPIMVELQEMNT